MVQESKVLADWNAHVGERFECTYGGTYFNKGDVVVIEESYKVRSTNPNFNYISLHNVSMSKFIKLEESRMLQSNVKPYAFLATAEKSYLRERFTKDNGLMRLDCNGQWQLVRTVNFAKAGNSVFRPISIYKTELTASVPHGLLSVSVEMIGDRVHKTGKVKLKRQ